MLRVAGNTLKTGEPTTKKVCLLNWMSNKAFFRNKFPVDVFFSKRIEWKPNFSSHLVILCLWTNPTTATTSSVRFVSLRAARKKTRHTKIRFIAMSARTAAFQKGKTYLSILKRDAWALFWALNQREMSISSFEQSRNHNSFVNWSAHKPISSSVFEQTHILMLCL